jgi:5'-nucleotidase
MTTKIDDLAKARILVTNDDGIDAAGIVLLAEIAQEMSDDVWVVAPEQEQSGAGHSLTLRRPLRIKNYGDRRYGVDGTPTDSVLMAVGHVLREHKPDLVLSGINRGGNLGEDVTYSGTVSAAMEGTLLGVPSIAISLVTSVGARPHWDTAKAHVPGLLRRLTGAGWPKADLISINIPDVSPGAVKGVRVVGLGRRKLGGQLEERFDPRGFPYYWIGPLREEESQGPDTDIAAVYDGFITVTPVHLDLTDRRAIRGLSESLEIEAAAARKET